MSNSQPFKAYKALNYAILIIIFYPSPHFFVIDKKRPPPWLNQNGALRQGRTPILVVFVRYALVDWQAILYELCINITRAVLVVR